MKDDIFLYQHKDVLENTKTHSIKMRDLELLRQHAIDEGLRPAYVVEHRNRRWYMIEEDLLEFLKDYLELIERGPGP